MRKLLLCLLVVMLAGSVVYAEEINTVVTTSGDAAKIASKLVPSLGAINLGYLKVGSSEVGSLSWHPDFKFGSFGLGADINYPLGSAITPTGYENIVLRYVEYNDGKRGLRYGVIDNLTWGHGLLVDAYSTRPSGSVLLNNEQLAYLGFVDMEQNVVRALVTKKGVYGVRAEQRINPTLTLGETYITDSNGVTPAGTTLNQKVGGVGIDATMPLPANFEGYAEYAQLLNHGSGWGAGFSWAQDIMVAAADFTIGYRFLDSRFVPGYFNTNYQNNPINLTSAEASGNVKNGYVAKLGLKAMGMATLNAKYENYNDSGSATFMADLSAVLPQDVEVAGYYQQPKFVNFSSLSFEQGAVLGYSIAYPVNTFTKMVLNYKKAYNATIGQVEESQSYEVKINI